MNTDKNTDAFRLGCYSAAKHAGATHLEALAFVSDLDAQARAQDAFSLGAYKVAADHGASHEEALVFSKEAWGAAAAQVVEAVIGDIDQRLVIDIAGGAEHHVDRSGPDCGLRHRGVRARAGVLRDHRRAHRGQRTRACRRVAPVPAEDDAEHAFAVHAGGRLEHEVG